MRARGETGRKKTKDFVTSTPPTPSSPPSPAGM